MKVLDTLTNFARGYAAAKADPLVKFLAPDVVTGAASGYYVAYSDAAQYQAYNAQRPIGGKATRIVFGTDLPSYNCTPNALEIPHDDHEKALGHVDVDLFREGKVSTLIGIAVRSEAVVTVQKARTTLTAVASKGDAWSSTDDPIAEIDEQILAISDEIGQMPNRILFGLKAWSIFKNNAKVVSRFNGAASANVTTMNAPTLFLNPNMQIMVSALNVDANPIAVASRSKASIVKDDVFIFFAEDSPNPYDPSLMKTFRVRGGGVDQVKMYRSDDSRSDIYAVDWTSQVVATSSASGRRLTVA